MTPVCACLRGEEEAEGPAGIPTHPAPSPHGSEEVEMESRQPASRGQLLAVPWNFLHEILHLIFIIFPNPASQSSALSLHTSSYFSRIQALCQPGFLADRAVHLPVCRSPELFWYILAAVPPEAHLPGLVLPGQREQKELEGVWNLQETAPGLLGLDTQCAGGMWEDGLRGEGRVKALQASACGLHPSAVGSHGRFLNRE